MTTIKSGDDESEYGYAEVRIPRRIRFWLLLSFNTPAMLCTIYLLYQLLLKRNLRQALHNHVIIALLFVVFLIQLTDILPYIIFVKIGRVWLQIPVFCNVWSYANVGLFNIMALLMAWGAIERHILIFHKGWINTQRKKILVHYLPFVLTIIYGNLFRIIVIFFPSCENYYDYSQPWCGYLCYYKHFVLATCDTVINYVFPILLIIVFNIALIIRYIRQKRRIQRVIQWRKHRKMILQLTSVCLLHFIFFLPQFVIILAYKFGLPADVGVDVALNFYFFSYFTILLLPYVCLISLPEIWKKFNLDLARWLTNHIRRFNTIIPATI